MLEAPVFGIPPINFEDVDCIDDPVGQAISAKKDAAKLSNPLLSCVRPSDTEAVARSSAPATGWGKVARMVFSPAKRFNDFSRYVEEKLSIERKVLKFPFRDLRLKDLIRKQQAQTLQPDATPKKKARPVKNARPRLVSSQSEKFSLQSTKLIAKSVHDRIQQARRRSIMLSSDVSSQWLQSAQRQDLSQIEDQGILEEDTHMDKKSFL